MRFIRVNGRVVPIKDKGPSKSKMAKNYAKHGDGANQSARIDRKFDDKATKAGSKYGYAAVAAFGASWGASAAGKGKLFAGLTAAGFGLAAIGHHKIAQKKKQLALARERAYVRTFGMTSDGQRPSRKKTGV